MVCSVWFKNYFCLTEFFVNISMLLQRLFIFAAPHRIILRRVEISFDIASIIIVSLCTRHAHIHCPQNDNIVVVQ